MSALLDAELAAAQSGEAEFTVGLDGASCVEVPQTTTGQAFFPGFSASAGMRESNPPADARTDGGLRVATPALPACYTPITQHDEQTEGEKR